MKLKEPNNRFSTHLPVARETSERELTENLHASNSNTHATDTGRPRGSNAGSTTQQNTTNITIKQSLVFDKRLKVVTQPLCVKLTELSSII